MKLINFTLKVNRAIGKRGDVFTVDICLAGFRQLRAAPPAVAAARENYETKQSHEGTDGNGQLDGEAFHGFLPVQNVI